MGERGPEYADADVVLVESYGASNFRTVHGSVEVTTGVARGFAQQDPSRAVCFYLFL